MSIEEDNIYAAIRQDCANQPLFLETFCGFDQLETVDLSFRKRGRKFYLTFNLKTSNRFDANDLYQQAKIYINEHIRKPFGWNPYLTSGGGSTWTFRLNRDF